MGEAVSKSTLLKVPGFGTLSKVHLEVSLSCFGACFQSSLIQAVDKKPPTN